MKLEDRIQALKRSDRYRKDYKKYDEYRRKHRIIDSCIIDGFTATFTVSPEGKKLCRRYKIPYPFDPDQDIAVLPGNQFLPLEKGMKIPSIFPIPLKITKQGEQTFGLEHGKYLHVAIDIDQNLDTLKKDLQRLREIYSRKQQQDERDRDTALENNGKSLTIWEIYDKVHKDKKAKVQITREFFDVQGSPGYEFNQSLYKQVKEAYNKAAKLIESVNSSK